MLQLFGDLGVESPVAEPVHDVPERVQHVKHSLSRWSFVD